MKDQFPRAGGPAAHPQKLDNLLRSWEVAPPPSLTGSADEAWDERAASILEKARSAGASNEITALLAAPSLEAEAGEPAGSIKVSGEKKMSDDRDSPPSGPSSVRPSMRSGSGRPSLKELAERVSKTPPPPSVRIPEAAPSPRASAPSIERISATPAPPSVRPLAVAITTPLPKPALAKTAPANESLAAPSGESVTKPAANDVAPSVAAKPAASSTRQEKKSNVIWLVLGGGVVAAAAAAAVFFYVNNKKTTQPNTATNTKPEVTATSEQPKANDAPAELVTGEVAKELEKKPGGVDLDAIGDAKPEDSAAPSLTGHLSLPAPSAIATNDDPPKDDTKDGPHRVDPNGTLDDAMRDAAGPDDEKHAEPASAPTGPKNLPDTPPNGSVTAAIGSVRGAAKGCVAGADQDSVASIVFGSSGSVQSVSVGGWAAGKPAAGCIQAAVKGAHVEPFTKPSFAVSMTIRP